MQANGIPRTFQVARLDLATGQVEIVLTRQDGMTAEQPRISPDETQLVYTRFKDPAEPLAGSAIFVSDLDGGRERRLTEFDAYAAYPDWSPDGSLIVFNTFDLGAFQDITVQVNLFTIKPDGSDIQRLTDYGENDTRATQPRWAPDGSGIVYTQVQGAGFGTRTAAFLPIDGSESPWADDRPDHRHPPDTAADPMSLRALPCLLGLVLAACATAPAASPSVSVPSIAETPRPSPIPEPELLFDGNVPVAEDRELAAQCWGSGTPTILLESGGTRSNMGEWPTGFVKRLAAGNTVCLYSRAGGEGSTPPDGLLTRELVVDDAFTMLDWLGQEHGVNGPYVFVGWSFGGAVAMAEALEHPEETAGLVILDTDPISDFLATCAEQGRPKSECRAEYEGDKEAMQIGADIVAHEHPLPDIPAAIVSALIFPDCVEASGEDVSYDMSGQIITAPDCRTLAERVADVHAQG